MIYVDFVDYVVCVLHQVPVDWFNSVLQCRKQNKQACQLVPIHATVYETLGISDAKLLLSPSCKQRLSEWQRISVIAIEKQSTQVIRSVVICLLPIVKAIILLQLWS